jgi:hypothetical protein
MSVTVVEELPAVTAAGPDAMAFIRNEKSASTVMRASGNARPVVVAAKPRDIRRFGAESQ